MWYCPGSLLALWVMERYGLRVSLLAGFATQVAMITLSVTGVHIAEPHVAYVVVWVGQARSLRRGQRQRLCACKYKRATDARQLTRGRLQVVGSFGQPLFLNNVVRAPLARSLASCAAAVAAY